MPTTEALTIAPAGTWQLDPVHSSVEFAVPYLGGTFKGRFGDVRAELAVSGEQVALEGSAQVASVEVKDAALAAHLQSPEFFDAERFPELRFAATEVGLEGESVGVRGALTIKGVTKAVELTGRITPPLTDPFGNERLGLALSATVDRTDFGVSWNVPLPDGRPALANEVTLAADLYFVRQA